MTDDLHRNPTDAGNSDESDRDAAAFAEQFQQQWDASIDTLPGASAPDSSLWSRIRKDGTSRKPHRERKRRRESASSYPSRSTGADSALVSGIPTGVSPHQWHRGILIFASVVAVACIVFFLPGGSVDPQHAGMVREAREAMKPVPGEELGCNVESLTRDDVFEIVLDPTLFGAINTRELFATPPPSPWTYPHTETWLPESNGTVEMAGGLRSVRIPTAREFRGAKEALDRYLRCQQEATNYQLWALESPVEVQRQVLDSIARDKGWTYVDAWMDEEISEPEILETIDRLGPQLRSDGSSYMSVDAPSDDVVQSNPEVAASYVADNPRTGEVEYAWIGSQRVNPESGDVSSRRGAGLDATPVPVVEEFTDNLVVMILRFDAETEAWLVEWLIPTI